MQCARTEQKCVRQLLGHGADLIHLPPSWVCGIQTLPSYQTSQHSRMTRIGLSILGKRSYQMMDAVRRHVQWSIALRATLILVRHAKKCPCEKCVQKLPITRNYTYRVAKKRSADGTRGLLRYSWTQGIPLTKEGGPGFGRDCFIFDWSKGWTTDISDTDFAPPKDVKCTPRVHK